MSSTSNEPNGQIKVLTRQTYENLKPDGIDANTLYFVIEAGTETDICLSLYVGLSKCSDVVNLNELLGFTSAQTSIDLTPYFDENDIPVKDIMATNKIYFWQDANLGVVRAYIRSTIEDVVMPLYGTPMWEQLPEPNP